VETKPEPTQRARHLHEMCEQLSKFGQVPIELKRRTYKFIHVDDKYKFLFCTIPKLACTNWKRVFLAISDTYPDKDYVMTDMPGSKVHSTHEKYCKTLSDYSTTEIQERLKTYKKIIFVRDPFDRILSAYRDKMFRNDSNFFLKMAEHMKSKRTIGTSKSKNVTFAEFIQHLTDPDTFETSNNPHWERYSELSQPCVVQYNFIGKFETLDADIALALKYIGIDGIVKFPQRKTFYKKSKSSDISEQYFNEVPKYYLRKLWQHLKGDYLLFSYPVPNNLSDKSNL
jgi:hypothetical protein